MIDLDIALADAALPETTVPLCLRGDLLSHFEGLERQMQTLKPDPETLGHRGERRRLAEQIEAVREEMRDAAVIFTLRGLSRTAWQNLVAAHPPRKDNDGDRRIGYNAETFFTALVRTCLIDPVADDEQWARLDAVLSSGQFDELVDAALKVSRRRVDVPFSLAASATLRTSDGT